MVKIFTKDYQEVYRLNLVLLEFVRQGKWSEFISSVEDYIFAFSAVTEGQVVSLTPEEKKDIGLILQSLIDNEAEINRALKGRLDDLKKKLTSLRCGKKGSYAYSEQFSSGLH